MTGAEIFDRIVARACDEYGQTCAAPSDVAVSKQEFDALREHVKASLPVDIHEVCGDYDRPSSPWYGSRPSDTGFQSIALHTPVGLVRVRVS